MLPAVIFFGGCSMKDQKKMGAMHFQMLDATVTNVDFNNKISESDTVNFYTNEYMYNGSGVGIGDFNNDGLQDIFFGGSMVSSKLYINKGDFKFADITKSAGLITDRWCTGISVIDINNDGFQDIYVSSSHSGSGTARKNLLFINNGKLQFTEEADSYGLGDTGFSTQAAFLDYDKDGDLDMYLLNHRLYNRNPNNLVPKDTSGFSPAQDCLYQNEGVPPGKTHPVFTNIAAAAGIKEDGYGLGLVITDVNNDSWPDIYVANDYIGNDLLWLNNKNGTFTNIIARALQHQSFNSMGVDAADINNDALPDIAVLDMSPETNERKKMMFNGSSQERYDMERTLGYEPTFVRNMLQLSNGLKNNNGRPEPFYSEIGQLAGISETDWSWSVLMADFDNDGWKDVHITNGLARDLTNNDYVTFKNAQNEHEYTFNGGIATNKTLDKASIELLRKNLDQYGSINVHNYFFRNKGDLSFSDETISTGLDKPSVSNGAAYADLDNDGDLDLVVNNMNEPAFLCRNELRGSDNDTAANFLAIQLVGSRLNPAGLGTKLIAYVGGSQQFLEQSPVRGFCSSMDQRLYFGIGKNVLVDSVKITWPDNAFQVIKNVKLNQLLVVENGAANNTGTNPPPAIEQEWLSELSATSGLNFTHTEGQYFDFGTQRAVPQKFSQLGPCLATADINGDGEMDVFVGGAAGYSGKLFIQGNGKFESRDLVLGQKLEEDLEAAFFDADRDGDADLLITGGSPEFGVNKAFNQPRLFTNDGKGNFSINVSALPQGIHEITKSIALGDFDKDGDTDVFLGGRLIPQEFPKSPRSYLLRNDGGKFTDVTTELAPGLERIGLVTGAAFADFDKDGTADLVVSGEWMPVQFFKNTEGRFKDITQTTGLSNMHGQWRSLQAADLDSDGDIDFVAGNLGLNNKFHISPDRPLKLYAGDFDGNNFTDIIPAYYIKDLDARYQLFPALDRTQLADQVPSIKKKFLLNVDYARLTMNDLLSGLKTINILEKKCETTTSVWIENLGNGKFRTHALPVAAQFAPINAIVLADLDGDSIKDLVLAGNEYQAEVVSGRYDASYGIILKGIRGGGYTAVRPTQSGFIMSGDVKDLIEVKTERETLLLAAVNNAPLTSFRLNQPKATKH